MHRAPFRSTKTHIADRMQLPERARQFSIWEPHILAPVRQEHHCRMKQAKNPARPETSRAPFALNGPKSTASKS